MKTIAITIDEDTLARLDQVGGPSRSHVIREAVREHVARLERQAQDERDGAVIHRHRAKLGRQAAALVRAQAKP